MRVAFTYNLWSAPAEEQAEFDAPEVVDWVCGAIVRHGHTVEAIDVSSFPPAVERLVAFAPDLVFNVAEGRRGRLREALVPALLDELGVPYTGSGAHTMAVTLDKALTKELAVGWGVRTPRWRAVSDPEQLEVGSLRPPLFVKPRFEGSSKGITLRSVVDDPAELAEVVDELLTRYPDGVVVEEFVAGRDVSVPFLEGAAAGCGGVLAPIGYRYRDVEARRGIYDFDLKNDLYDDVDLDVPVSLDPPMAAAVHATTLHLVRAFGIRDLGRFDYRLGDDGRLYFLEVNPLPNLELQAGIYACAALEGVDADGVIGLVIESALRRQVPTTAMVDGGRGRSRA